MTPPPGWHAGSIRSATLAALHTAWVAAGARPVRNLALVDGGAAGAPGTLVDVTGLSTVEGWAYAAHMGADAGLVGGRLVDTTANGERPATLADLLRAPVRGA